MNRSILCLILFISISLYPSFSFPWQEDLKKGIEEYRAENFEEAFDLLYKARHENRESSVIAFYLGLVYKQTGDHDKASLYFKEAIDLKPPVVEAFGELIEMYYALNKNQEALEYIAKAETLRIEPAKISFLKGLVFLKLNKNLDAIRAFESAKKEDVNVTQAADLQIALTYAKERKVSKALKSLRSVISINPNSELGQFARDYELAYLKSIEAYKATRLSASLSYIYDTNVTAKPSSDIGLPPSNEKDSGFMGYFSLNYTPFSETDFLFTAQYSASGTFYHKLTDFNSIAQSFMLSPGYNIERGSFTLPMTYGHNIVGGKGYMATLTVKPSFVYMLSQENFLSSYVGLSHRNMIQETFDPDEERDAKILSGGIGYMHSISEGKGILNLRYEYVIDNTKGANWKNKGSKFNVSLVSPLSERIDMLVSLEAYLQDYKNENTIFKVKRSDKSYNINAGASIQVIKGLFVNTQIAYTLAQSNIPLYDYKKTIFTMGIESRF